MKTLLSFLSPCGRLGRLGFWTRQLLLAPLLGLGIISTHVAAMFERGWAITPEPTTLEDALIMVDIACLPHILSLGWGSVMAETLAGVALLHTEAMDPLIPLLAWGGCALSLLVTWCCAALILRRLRDTRPGLWLLPACMPALWLFLLHESVQLEGAQRLLPAFLLLALSNIVLCLPSRNTPPPPQA